MFPYSFSSTKRKNLNNLTGQSHAFVNGIQSCNFFKNILITSKRVWTIWAVGNKSMSCFPVIPLPNKSKINWWVKVMHLWMELRAGTFLELIDNKQKRCEHFQVWVICLCSVCLLFFSLLITSKRCVKYLQDGQYVYVLFPCSIPSQVKVL